MYKRSWWSLMIKPHMVGEDVTTKYRDTISKIKTAHDSFIL